jgi:hypothetical protein
MFITPVSPTKKEAPRSFFPTISVTNVMEISVMAEEV